MLLLTVLIIITITAIELTLDILNIKNTTQPIPDNVADVYDQDQYNRWKAYNRETFRLDTLKQAVQAVLTILLLASGFFPWLASLAEAFTNRLVVHTLIFFMGYFIIEYIFLFIYSYFKTFRIEEKYGFNNYTLKGFLLDELKGILLFLVFGFIIAYPLMQLYLTLGNRSFFYAWLLITGFKLVIFLLYGKVLIRLFNKITPLPNGELCDQSQALAASFGYEIKNINVINASKQSTKLNAFFTGFGRYKSIMLYDTLMEKLTTEEIISILAHELGHAKAKDTIKNLFFDGVKTAFYLILLAFFLSNGSFIQDFGFDRPFLGFSILLFGVLIQPLSLIVSMPLSIHSKKAEFTADATAVDAGYGHEMIRSLKVLARENFVNLTPHPLTVKLTYSHPSVSQRIQAIESRLISIDNTQ